MTDLITLGSSTLAAATGGLPPATKRIIVSGVAASSGWLALNQTNLSQATKDAKRTNPSSCFGTWIENGAPLDSLFCRSK